MKKERNTSSKSNAKPRQETKSNTLAIRNSQLAIKKRALMPYGVSDFHKLITRRDSKGNAYLFVDKTLFIREFLDAGDEITLITRPRRFGKTLTLSMLQHFLAAEVDGQSTKGLFDGLNISEYPQTMKKQGQYPVIFLTLKRVKGDNFEKAFEEIKEEITKLFEAHDFLLKSDKVSVTQKERFQLYIRQDANEAKYKSSLAFLSRLLYQHTGKKVYILLDEYDTPINDAYINGYYEDCRKFLAGMLGETFKENKALERGLITGILKVAKAGLFSDLNNPKIYTTLSHKYADSFGFTSQETDGLLDRAHLPKKAHKLKEMYNGYQIGSYTLYNPFSIVSFIDEVLDAPNGDMQDALKPYWINTGGTHLIGYLIENNITKLEKGMMSLLDNQPIQTAIDENIVFDPQLRYNTLSFWSVLLLSGYVKSIESVEDEYGDEIHTLCFPNEEVTRSMRKLLLRVTFGKEESPEIPQIMQSLAQGAPDLFVEFVKEYLTTTVSYFDLHKKEKEKPYHLLILGMVAYFAKTHHARSNRESGKGRYDVSLEPKNKAKKGIIIELKVAKEGEDLKKVAMKAFDQVQNNQYKTDMEARGVKEFLFIGMAFQGKDLEAVTSY